MSSNRRILVVEDEAPLREIIVDLLKEHHLDVTSAENGVQALERVKKEEFTLIVSDIKMPEMSGLELLSQAQPFLHCTPVVFITAFGDHANIMAALRLGAFDFIKKPFDDEEVICVVDRALEVGFRRKLIQQEISQIPSEKRQDIDRHGKMISWLHVTNNKKRTS